MNCQFIRVIYNSDTSIVEFNFLKYNIQSNKVVNISYIIMYNEIKIHSNGYRTIHIKSNTTLVLTYTFIKEKCYKIHYICKKQSEMDYKLRVIGCYMKIFLITLILLLICLSIT